MEVRDKRVRVQVRMETFFEVFVPGDRRMPPIPEVLDRFREKYGNQYEDYEIDSVDTHNDGWILTVVALNGQQEISHVESMGIDMRVGDAHITIWRTDAHAHDCTEEGPEMTTDVLSYVVTDGPGDADKG